MKDINIQEWFPNIDLAIGERLIPSFPTKKVAIEAARKFGWRANVVRIIRRFEKVWVVGRVDFQPSYEGGLRFEVLRVSLLRWDDAPCGSYKMCPVATFRKYVKEN
jgi:hypothetical protein